MLKAREIRLLSQHSNPKRNTAGQQSSASNRRIIAKFYQYEEVNTMPTTDINIYALCRRRTGMTQEAWAEALDISVESVKRYELGVRVPPNYLVKEMVDISGDEALAYRHLANTSQILEILPSIESINLQAATIRLMNRMARFANQCRDRRLMEIADDGIISEDERPLYKEILDELTGIITAFYQLRYFDDKEVK